MIFIINLNFIPAYVSKLAREIVADPWSELPKYPDLKTCKFMDFSCKSWKFFLLSFISLV